MRWPLADARRLPHRTSPSPYISLESWFLSLGPTRPALPSDPSRLPVSIPSSSHPCSVRMGPHWTFACIASFVILVMENDGREMWNAPIRRTVTRSGAHFRVGIHMTAG